MQTECSANAALFAPVERRSVVAAFDGGALTSDAGGLLLGATDRAIGLIARFAACFRDRRRREFVEHSVATLVGQRVFGIALGYEDLNDHDELRHDPLMAVLSGKLAARRPDCAAVAGKSTLNRLELSREVATRYHKISHDPQAIEALFVDVFLARKRRRPSGSCSISTPPTTPCTAIRRGGSSTAVQQLLLSALVRVLRPASAGGQAAALEHRRQRRRRGGGRAHRRANAAPAGRACAFCFAPIPAFAARR